jgi:hypothetical protein
MADCAPNPAAARLAFIPGHVDELMGAGARGVLDARALDFRPRVLRAPDRPPTLRARMSAIARLCRAEPALVLCCVLLRSKDWSRSPEQGWSSVGLGAFSRWAPRADLTGRHRNAPRARCGLVNVAAGADGLVRASSPRVCAAGFGCAVGRVLTRSESRAGDRASGTGTRRRRPSLSSAWSPKASPSSPRWDDSFSRKGLSI